MTQSAALLFCLLTQAAPTPPATPAPVLLEARLAKLVDEGAMQREVRELCKLGPRMGGTESGHRSAEYLKKRFAELGLDVRVVEDPPRWCHEEKKWRVVALRDGSPHHLASAWPYGFSPSAEGRAKLTGEPGEKVVLVAERAPTTIDKQRMLAVLVTGNTTLDGAYPRISHLPARADNPAPVFGLNREDAQWIEKARKSDELLEIEFALEAKIAQASPRTVIARLPARDSKAEPWTGDHILFCAHGDSDAGGPGADDNASGMAVLLGIASAWKRAIDEKLVEAPECEIRFAIWGSEIHSTKHLLARGDQDGKVLAVLNYDQAGYGSGADQFNIEPDDLPANAGLVKVLLAVLADHGGSEGFPKRWASNKSLGGTDSYVFSGSPLFKEGARPSVTLFTSAWDKPAEHPRTPGMKGESWQERDQVNVDYDNYYHSAGDTPENTTDKEPWNMGWCARIGMLAARRAAEGAGAR